MKEKFDEWYGTYTACTKCRTHEPTRLAASNAWYIQQFEIDSLQQEIDFLRTALRQISDLAQKQSTELIPGRIMATAIFILLGNKEQVKVEMKINSEILKQ